MLKQFIEKYECSGCGGCVSDCKYNALYMKEDEEGFMYPRVREEKCTECGLCIEVCGFKKRQLSRSVKDEKINTEKEIFIGRNKDAKVVEESRSGGIFTALSDYVLENDGVVYGCVFDENFQAVCISANNTIDRDRMRGSKYVQSILGEEVFAGVKERINNQQLVLFTGTPCQVDAIRRYIGADNEYLITMDVVCHGVVSPAIWKLYKKYMIQRYEGCKRILAVDFRNKKKFGWADHIETITMIGNEDKLVEIDSTIYRKVFYEHYALRPACYVCPYKSQKRQSDITVGDAWGIERIDSKYNDNKGCSIILVNTEKGKRLLDKIKDYIDIEKRRMSDVFFQEALHVSYEVNMKKREDFWEKVKNKGICIFDEYEDN